MTEDEKPDRLTLDEEFGLLTLIENSVALRYEGDLERQEDPRAKCADTYTACDTDNIRELLATLWSEHVSAETLERVFETLTVNGVAKEKWPHAWCEEDLEYERIQRGRMIDRLDNEIEDTEAHLATLKHERDQLTNRNAISP